MTPQVRNPLGFYCSPNGSTPDYIVYHDFKSWLAYGMIVCWLSHTADDPNGDCHFARPYTREDVAELRHYFLSTVETVIVALWRKQCRLGDGDIQGDYKTLSVELDEEEDPKQLTQPTFLQWGVRLDDDSIMFDLTCSRSDPIAIWLSYEGIKDRNAVLAAITEARATLQIKYHKEVWRPLYRLASGRKRKKAGQELCSI